MFWTEARASTRATATALGAVAIGAWLSLLVWDLSPYDRYLDHGSFDDLQLAAPVAVAVFVGGWVLMIVAMMLPTTYPVVALFREVVRRRDDRGRLLAICVAGYLSVWAAFGGLAFVGDLGVHAAVDQLGWVERRPWVVTTAVLAVAGAYQFTSLKHRCLTKCRSPRVVVIGHWTGRNPRLEAFTLGTDSGLYCVGCCWSMMLVVFAAGVGSIPLMLGLGALMAVEKNVTWGRHISAPLGVALCVAAALVGLGPLR